MDRPSSCAVSVLTVGAPRAVLLYLAFCVCEVIFLLNVCERGGVGGGDMFQERSLHFVWVCRILWE